LAAVKSKRKIGLICQVFCANNHAAIKVSNRFANNDVVAPHTKGMRMLGLSDNGALWGVVTKRDYFSEELVKLHEEI